MSLLPERSEGLPQRSLEIVPRERDFEFLMLQNGFKNNEGYWIFSQEAFQQKTEQLRALEVNFFGPNDKHSHFFRPFPTFYEKENFYVPFARAFAQKPVLDLMTKFRKLDSEEEQAGRIAFLLGGIAREMLLSKRASEVTAAINLAAKMTHLGDYKSGDAVAASMVMYSLSGGRIENNPDFTKDVYNMVEAISEDPTVPQETADLGLSQHRRLRSFIDKFDKEDRIIPDISKDRKELRGFPTVGAEFHLPPNAPSKDPYFWQRLAILNMSQYQLGNYVQFCRNDQGVIEIRMNPSTYPITIANWNYMKIILPELKEAYFTATFNRDERDFSWDGFEEDNRLLAKLRALGLLSYAAIFKNTPSQSKREEINFGDNYLGQTVKMKYGKIGLDGDWSGNKGKYGQFALYAGFGENFPYLAYYSSMALANPDILDSVSQKLLKIYTLDDALQMSPEERKAIFRSVNYSIREYPSLLSASEAGTRIIQKLTP